MSDPDEAPPFARDGLITLAREMALYGTERDSPTRSVMALLGDRWTSLILLVLATGELRHAELRRILSRLAFEQAISQRMLTLKLRALERDGFVVRRVSDDVPPKVGYDLTPLGTELVSQTRQIIAWTTAHTRQIHQARAAYDSAVE